MRICDVHDSCALFNNEIIGLDITTRIMKSKYCLDNFSKCICYWHSKELETVPAGAIYHAVKGANNRTVSTH